MNERPAWQGIMAAFAAPVFLGVAPIFGKLAIESGADAFTLAALRTLVAVAILWCGYALFARRYIYIYPAGLVGCIVIGTINGIGSLFYYSGLQTLDASLVQLINGSYLAFAILLTRLGGQRADARTLLRVSLAMLALLVITSFNVESISWMGVGFMLANALMFAGTVVLSQYVLYEMPAPTAALYILTTMGIVVSVVWLAVTPNFNPVAIENALVWIVALGMTTALSRLMLFASVKFLGSMQTAILGITEIAVSLVLALVILGDVLIIQQWIGVGLLFLSILLIRQTDLIPASTNLGHLVVANLASMQFQKIAFHRAFGTQEDDNAQQTMGTITTQEMVAIQRMMGAESGGLDPFPISKLNTTRQNKVVTEQDIEIPTTLRNKLKERFTKKNDEIE
jgi:drug/metabolite transporter (DMT)-like permease